MEERMSKSQKFPKILIVDDDYSFAAYAKMLLELRRCETSICLDGRAALQSALREKPDLILMDMNLQACKGTDAIRILKSNPETENIPILLCSITHSRAEVQEALDTGAADFLPKPLKIEALMGKVDGLLDIHE